MIKLAGAAALALTLSTGAGWAIGFPSFAAALAPHATARPGHKPRSARMEHCARKADSIGVQGKARAIYLRKCGGA